MSTKEEDADAVLQAICSACHATRESVLATLKFANLLGLTLEQWLAPWQAIAKEHGNELVPADWLKATTGKPVLYVEHKEKAS